MRKFLVNVIILCLTAATILCFITWLGVRKIEHTSFLLSSDTHSIAIGPSTMQESVNDTLIDGLQNISRDGTDIMYIVPLIPQILKENPQIDTIYIQHGRFSYMFGSLVDNNQKMQFLRDKLPFIWHQRKSNEWRELLKNENLYAAVLNPKMQELSEDRSSLSNYGFRFGSGDGSVLYDDSKEWSIAWYDSITSAHGGNTYSKDEILKKNALNEKYTRLAIRICKEHNVVPVLFFTPLYQYDRWFPYEPFCEVMKDYDPNTLIADYENFVFSNDSLCRRDVHHLNIYGANEFSEYLAKNGIQTVKLKDWLSSKSH